MFAESVCCPYYDYYDEPNSECKGCGGTCVNCINSPDNCTGCMPGMAFLDGVGPGECIFGK